MTDSLDALLEEYRPRFETKLRAFLAQRREAADNQAQQALFDALEYSALDGGKRLRPMLVYLTTHCSGRRDEATLLAADCAAIAVELVHCYSLVHDDLPAMDDDDLRRGKPSAHIEFGEAVAILAGDALQALAFEALADSPATDLSVREQLRTLAVAAGAGGMVGGQAIDLAAAGESTGTRMTEQALTRMHRLKTGALIESAVKLGALCAGAGDLQQRSLLAYARALGLAFQVRDDVLDVEGSAEETGKATGADAALGKPTFTSLLGVEEAGSFAKNTVASAVEALAALGSDADALVELASYVIERKK